MANYGKLRVTELDFDAIKQNIKNYLRQYPGFTDYDFEGSALNVLVNTLAYNTHYLAFYMNMLSSEAFLDSAVLRQSVVSHAKHLNYMPSSRKAATSIVNITIDPSPATPAFITIPKGHQFSTSSDVSDFIFSTKEAITVTPNAGVYTATEVPIIQGEWYTYTSLVDSSIPKQRFIIPDANVDVSTITVKVQNSATDLTQDVYAFANDFNVLTPTDKVYFLQEAEYQKYEVYFGDNVIGTKPVDGNYVVIEYLVTDGVTGNYIGGGNTATTRFYSAGPIQGNSSITVTTLTPGFGGAEREDIEHVRFAAPKNYQAQNRAVTINDYKTLLVRDYPNALSVSVWGGEDNEPPTYGKVFISIRPVQGYELTRTTKEYIKNTVLKKYNVVSIVPEIVDPSYIYLIVDTTIKYDAIRSVLTEGDLKSVVINAIKNFAATNINQFERTFKYSKLTTEIDACNFAVNNNVTNIKMKKKFIPRLDVNDQYAIRFHNPIVPGSLTSTGFTIIADPMISYFTGDQYYFDDLNGLVRIYKIVQSEKVVMKENAGTINYTTGEIILTNYLPHTILDGSEDIKLTVKPLNIDVIPVRNDLIVLDDLDINVKMQVDSSTIL